MPSHLLALAIVACAAAAPFAQTLAQAVNLAALVTYPNFYADRAIVVRGHFGQADGRVTFEDEDGHRVLALAQAGRRPEGNIDATGQLWDLGRMKQDDPRLSGYDVAPIVKATGQEWPRPGDVFVFAVTSTTPVDAAPVSTIRSIVLEGTHAAGRLVTISGQFRGRNLFGDMPRSPGNNPADFVLRSSGASIWVSGLPAKGKDFQLDPGSRVDTDKWLRVSGIVRESKGLLWLEAKSIALAERDATQTDAPAKAADLGPPPPPPEVVFSVPLSGETDVDPSAPVRIQLSRDLDPKSLEGRVQVAYILPAAAQNAPLPQPPRFKVELDERERVMTLRFDQPLERFRTVRVALLDGIKGTDGQPLKPWQITFTVGGKEG